MRALYLELKSGRKTYYKTCSYILNAEAVNVHICAYAYTFSESGRPNV